MKDFFQTIVYANVFTNTALAAIEQMETGRNCWLNKKIMNTATTDLNAYLDNLLNLSLDEEERVLLSKLAREAANAIQEQYEYCARQTEYLYRNK